MLFGYDDKIKAFQKLIREGKLGQSYLFYGDRGIGKNTFATLLAYALETGKFAVGNEPFLDTLFITRNPEENSLGIERISDVKRFLWQKPFKSSHRLVVVDDSEDLTPEAQGALLKIVEEPPAHALLIFIAHDPQVLLPPLVSRLAKIYFPRAPKEAVKRVLIDERGAGVKKADEIASRSFGRIGYALNLLESVPETGEEDLEKFLETKILKLRRENLKENASLLAWLLDREGLVKRYNLNMNLQKRATEAMINRI